MQTCKVHGSAEKNEFRSTALKTLRTQIRQKTPSKRIDGFPEQSSNKATNSGAIQKLFGGKSIEAQALELTLQKNRAVQLEKDLKDLFLWSGRGDLWESTIRERARLRNMRIAEAKARAQSKAAMLDILAIIGTIATVFVVAMAITSVAVE